MKWLTLVLTCLAFPLFSQQEPVVYSVDGRAKYSPTEKGWFNYEPLKTGMRLNKNGRLKLKGGTTVSLLYDEQYATITAKGRQSINRILEDFGRFRENTYTVLLQERVEEANDPFFFYIDEEPGLASTTKPTKPKYESKEGDGHGDADANLLPITTNGGKVAGSDFFVSWAPKEGVEAPGQYVFKLTDDNGKALFETTTGERNLTVRAAEAQLTAGKFYRWQAIAADNPSVRTPSVTIEYVAEDAIEAVLKPLRNDPIFQSADPAARLLLEAVALEQNGFQESAGLRYRSAMEQDPDHDLARALYKAFLWRQGL